jgi:hypothetical protein
MWRNARTAAYILGIWLVFYPLIYYFVQVLPRYRYPVLWASFLAGSYFVVEVVRGIIAKNVTSEASTNSELRPAEYI